MYRYVQTIDINEWTHGIRRVRIWAATTRSSTFRAAAGSSVIWVYMNRLVVGVLVVHGLKMIIIIVEKLSASGS